MERIEKKTEREYCSKHFHLCVCVYYCEHICLLYILGKEFPCLSENLDCIGDLMFNPFHSL